MAITSVIILDPAKLLSKTQKSKLKERIKASDPETLESKTDDFLESIHYTGASRYRGMSITVTDNQAMVNFTLKSKRDILKRKLKEKHQRGELWDRYRAMKSTFPVPSPWEIAESMEQSQQMVQMLGMLGERTAPLCDYYKRCMEACNAKK